MSGVVLYAFQKRASVRRFRSRLEVVERGVGKHAPYRREASHTSTSRRDLSDWRHALRKAAVETERAGAEGDDLEQAARHHHILQKVDHLVLVGKIAME